MGDNTFPERMQEARKAKAAKKEKPATAQGVGESQRFGGNYNPERSSEELDWSKLTLNGMPIAPDLYNKLPYFYTDQAIAEREAKRGPDAGRVQFVRDQQDKVVDKYADGLAANMEPWEGGIDPLLETKKRHEEPGWRYRYVSERKAAIDGWRGWKAVEVAIGGVKQMIKIGNSILARMPEDKAKQRDRFMREKAESQMVAATEKVQELRDQFVSETDLKRIARRRRADEHEGFQSVRGDVREADDPDFQGMEAEYMPQGGQEPRP